jgi:uncharacterized protein (TIGR02145 family)
MRKYSLILFLLFSTTGLLLYCSGPTEPDLDNPYDQESGSYVPAPDLNTAPVTPLAQAAITGGEFTNDYGKPITRKGVCWSTNENPDTGDSCTNDGEGIGSFESQIEGLEVETTYYIRAYASNTDGTSYGDQRRFKTRDGVPNVSTTEPFDISVTSAVTGGSITDDGGTSITQAGVCYQEGSGTPDFSNICVARNSESNNYEIILEELQKEQTYSLRAFASTEFATGWGNTYEYIAFNTQISEVANPETGRVWMDRNLGASRAAISSTDSEAYGDLYQWGRAADGHQNRNSSTTSTQSGSDKPGHGDFIIGPTDWRSSQNDNLWQGIDGINNPCPSGYRLPTKAEWDEEMESWSSDDRNGAFASPLKLPVSGSRGSSSGSLFAVGSSGSYWSSSVSGTDALRLIFSSSNANTSNNFRASGNSIRCIKD